MPHACDDAIPQGIPRPLIDEALTRVLASRGFRGSTRKRRFLQFIVQETLAGHAARIKAYTIALDVFDRDASFDPLLDPVVRIQAGRIRRCLEQYYLTEGVDDPVQISIPKGSYVPHFTVMRDAEASAPATSAAEPSAPGEPSMQDAPPAPRRLPRAMLPVAAVLATLAVLLVAALSVTPGNVSPGPRTTTSAGAELAMAGLGASTRAAPTTTTGDPPAANVRGPAMLVLPFANGTGDPAQDVLADGFTEDVVAALIRFRSLVVYGADTSFRYRSAPPLPPAEPAAGSDPKSDPKIDPKIDYVLKGSVSRVGNQVQVTAALIRAKDRRYFWSDSLLRDFSPATMIDLRRDIAVQVARALAQPNGVIDEEEARHAAARPPTQLSSYECLLRTRQYWHHLNAALHAEVRTCLERTVRADPLYADAWAALAMVTIDEARLGFNPIPAHPAPITAGLELATHAATLAPDAPLPLQALGLAHWLNREPRLAIAAYERALAGNPHDSVILADLGRCYSLTGDWDRGIPLIREAFARNPAQPSWYRIVFALHHYVNGRYDEALAEARRVDVPESVLPHIALAMIHGQTGNKAEAAGEVQAILRIDPTFEANAVTELERRNITPDTIARILDGLRKAGLAVPVPSATVNGG